MAGHLMAAYLQRAGHAVTATVRPGRREEPALRRTLPPDVAVRELDARDMEAVLELVRQEGPQAIINAIGVLNAYAEASPIDAYAINGLLPHLLAHAAESTGARLVHISSDCVFSGRRGGYGVDDEPDGYTVYARSKALGEVRRAPHLTIRTSIIGPEIRAEGIGLMSWFLSQQGTVQGYVNVPWNGVTTLELAKAALWALEHPEVAGLVHLTAPYAISKHDLLHLMASTYGKNDVTIEPAAEPVIDRTLLPTRSAFAYHPPGYGAMLRELRAWERSAWL